jgi:hypothetical protein
MWQHSSDPDDAKWPLLGNTQIRGGHSNAILEALRDASCGRSTGVSQHRRDLARDIEATQRICPVTTRPKSRTSAASSVGSAPWVFTRRRNSSFNRSITLVVLSA